MRHACLWRAPCLLPVVRRGAQHWPGERLGRRHRSAATARPSWPPPAPPAAFRYSHKLAPRRLLTKPAEPASNGGWDNATKKCGKDMAPCDQQTATNGTCPAGCEVRRIF